MGSGSSSGAAAGSGSEATSAGVVAGGGAEVDGAAVVDVVAPVASTRVVVVSDSSSRTPEGDPIEAVRTTASSAGADAATSTAPSPPPPTSAADGEHEGEDAGQGGEASTSEGAVVRHGFVTVGPSRVRNNSVNACTSVRTEWWRLTRCRHGARGQRLDPHRRRRDRRRRAGHPGLPRHPPDRRHRAGWSRHLGHGSLRLPAGARRRTRDRPPEPVAPGPAQLRARALRGPRPDPTAPAASGRCGATTCPTSPSSPAPRAGSSSIRSPRRDRRRRPRARRRAPRRPAGRRRHLHAQPRRPLRRRAGRDLDRRRRRRARARCIAPAGLPRGGGQRERHRRHGDGCAAPSYMYGPLLPDGSRRATSTPGSARPSPLLGRVGLIAADRGDQRDRHRAGRRRRAASCSSSRRAPRRRPR